jgi:hypothetical protein
MGGDWLDFRLRQPDGRRAIQKVVPVPPGATSVDVRQGAGSASSGTTCAPSPGGVEARVA